MPPKPKDPPPTTTTAISFDTSATGANSTQFLGTGAMVWSSISGSIPHRKAARYIYGDQNFTVPETGLPPTPTNMNWVRVNYETYPDPTVYPNGVPTGLSYNEYVAFWNDPASNSVDGFFPIVFSSDKTLIWVIVGKIPSSFLYDFPGDPTYKALNPAHAIDYANYLAASINHWKANNAIKPVHVEINNEPDYIANNQYIAPSVYDTVLQELRTVLNQNNMLEVLIFGGGISHINTVDEYTPYLNNLEGTAYSNHAWIWGDVNYEGSQELIKQDLASWKSNTITDPSKILASTEYSANEAEFHGKSYPDCKGVLKATYATTEYPSSSAPNSADALSFGARIYYNTISLIQGGTNIPFYWELNDTVWWGTPSDPQGSGGYSMVDVNGKLVNPYYALRPFLELVPVNSRTAPTPNVQANDDIYEVVFVDDSMQGQTTVTVCMVNPSATAGKRNTYTENTKTRQTILQNLSASYTSATYEALRYSGPYKTTNPPSIGYAASPDVVQPVTNLFVSKSGSDWVFTADLKTDETLTVKITFA